MSTRHGKNCTPQTTKTSTYTQLITRQ